MSDKDPVEVLASIGLTGAERQRLMEKIEADRRDSARRLFHRASRSSLILRYLTMILWLYSFLVWLYVIAMQLRYNESPYWPLAWWMPVRLDYLGETSFVLSFLLGILMIRWISRQARDIKRLQELVK